MLTTPEEPEIIDPDEPKGKATDGPKRNPVFNLDMRDIFRQLVENTQEMVDINKKMEEWGQPIKGQSSELNMRKFMYNKVSNEARCQLTADYRAIPARVYDHVDALEGVHQLQAVGPWRQAAAAAAGLEGEGWLYVLREHA